MVCNEREAELAHGRRRRHRALPHRVRAAGRPSGNGCPKLAAGASAVSVSDVSAPARLQIDQIQSNPGTITLGTKSFTVRFHVSDTCGTPVKGAQVYATGVPYNMISIPSQQQTDDSGNVSPMVVVLGFKTLTPTA